MRLRSSRRRAALAMAGVCALVGVLTSCAQVPASSAPVVVGAAPVGGTDNFDDQLDLQPQGPRPNSPPDAVVRGFISASATTDPAHPIAKQFLTVAAAKNWRDSESVTIIAPTIGVQLGARTGEVTLQATRVGVVNSAGIVSADPIPLTLAFRLTEVSGQWRITNPPPGILISQPNFIDVYAEASVFFLDPTETRVVPDLRYFLRGTEQRVNLLVQALIDGPSPELASGVRNELGGEVDKVSQVSIVDGQARVQLSGIGQRNDTQLQALSAQVIWTLRDVPINSVRIYNDGVALAVPDVDVDQSLSDWDSFNPDFLPATTSGYFVQGGAVRDLTGKAVPGTETLGSTAAGVSVDGTRIAVVSGGGGTATLRQGTVGAGLTAVSLPDSTTLSAPTWGASSEDFWVVRNGTDVIRVPVKGKPAVVSAPGLSTVGRLVAMRRSRDGVRVAFLAERDGQRSVYLSVIVTGAGGISLTAPELLAPDAVAMDWIDSRTMVLLTASQGSDPVPYAVSIDGYRRDARTAPVFDGGATAIAAAPFRPLLCAGDGVVQRLEESSWVSLIAGTAVAGSNPFYPG